MRSARTGVLLLFLAAVLSFLSGCWDSIRLEERAIIIAMGIDPGTEGLLKVSINTPVFETPDVAPERVQRITTLAPSLMAAMDNLNMVSDKRFSVGQMRVVLFNREIAESGVFKILVRDLNHNPLVSQITGLAVLEGSCQEVFNLRLKDKPRTGPYISGILEDALRRRNIEESELWFIHSQLHNPLAVTFLPCLTFGETEVKVAGQAVFKNQKMVALISSEESGLAQSIKGDAKNFLFNASFSPEDTISARIFSNKTDRKLSWQDGVPAFDITVNLQVDLIGRHFEEDIIKQSTLEEIEGKLEHYLKGRYSRLAAFSQEKNVDIFRLSETVRSKMGKKMTPRWWDKTYPLARVEISPRVEIRRIGRTY